MESLGTGARMEPRKPAKLFLPFYSFTFYLVGPKSQFWSHFADFGLIFILKGEMLKSPNC